MTTLIPPPRRHCGFFGRIGMARAEITAPVGIYSRNWGAAKHDVASSIHRPLYLSVLTLAEPDGTPLVLVDADLGWWRPFSLFQEFQERLLNEIGLPASRVIFALTHTHASAPLMKSDSQIAGSEMQDPWLESVYQSTVATIQEALSNPFDGSLDWHAGSCQLAADRDLPDPESGRIVCGYNPARPADKTLVVGRVTDSHGQLRAVIANYACHPTTLAWDNESISPDFIGAMRETIEQASTATAFFLQGASGELAPRHQYVGDPSVADRHGKQLGYATLATLHDMEPPGTQLAYDGVVESGAPLAVWKHSPIELSAKLHAVDCTVDLDLKDWPTAEELERQRIHCDDRALEERLRRKRDIRRALGDGSTFAVPVSVWVVGDAILVGSCCEAYSLLQTELRRRFPDHSIVCMNLINGTIGYLPPENLYDADVYQVWQTPFARGGLERLIETLAKTIEELVV